MPNSDSTLTRDRIIRRAFLANGIESPSTDEMAKGLEILSDTLAELDPEGRWLWTVSSTESTVTTVTGQRAYDVGTDSDQIQNYIHAIETATIVSGTTRRPLQIFTKTEYQNSPLLEDTGGEPLGVYLEEGADPSDNQFLFLPTPNSAYTVNYTFQRMLYDMDAASDNPDVKRSMRMDLIKVLAGEIAPYFAIEPTKSTNIALGEKAKRDMRAKNKERSTPQPVRAEYY